LHGLSTRFTHRAAAGFRARIFCNRHYARVVRRLLRIQRADFLVESPEPAGVMTHMSRPGTVPRQQ